uniref:Odorant receptor n=1 Tax=Conogethes punctiferalis TaxID=1133088 RepID=A0A1X9PEX2_CONPF|nr:odorant receptor 21 [Conogethes punctiferalis]
MTSLAGGSVAPHLRVLRLVGFCRLRAPAGRAAPGLARRLHGLYCWFALAATSFYVLQQGIYAYQERHDMVKLSRVLFVLLCHCTCISKQVVFHAHAPQIDALIRSLDQPLFNQGGAAREALLRRAAARAARVLRAYYGCGIATCVLWTAFPVIYRLQGHYVEMPFWTFIDYRKAFMFVVVVSHSFYATNLVAVGNTTMDAFIATVLYQCQTQLRILRLNFESLPERARIASKELSKGDYEATLNKLLLECILHFQKIADTMELLQRVFGLAVLVQFTVGGWILCMAAYKIVSVDILSFEFASTTLFIVCILTELFLYCYYGNEVTVESDRVVESIYSMEWLHAPLRFKKSLVLMMERAKRPLRPAAGRVIPLSLDTFVTILKSSYSFYAVLRQTK